MAVTSFVFRPLPESFGGWIGALTRSTCFQSFVDGGRLPAAFVDFLLTLAGLRVDGTGGWVGASAILVWVAELALSPLVGIWDGKGFDWPDGRGFDWPASTMIGLGMVISLESAKLDDQ